MAQEVGAIMQGNNLALVPGTDGTTGLIVTSAADFDSVAVKGLGPTNFGTSEHREACFVRRTVDATVTQVGSTIVVPPGGGIVVQALVVGKRDTGADVSAYVLEAGYSRNAAGNLTIIGAVTARVLGETTVGTDATLTANTTLQIVTVSVTGVAAQNYNWNVHMRWAFIDGTLTA